MARIPSPLQKISDPILKEKQLEVWVKRDDLIHEHVMGNKWRKLKYNVAFACDNGYEGLLTFGGAFSNHIAATAACCKENGLRSKGIIRGDELDEQSNPTLRFAYEQGMELEFVSRHDYRLLKNDLKAIQYQHPQLYCLPEGGTNELAIKGCEEIIGEINIPFNFLITAIGTGGTMAGLLSGMKGQDQLIGVSALKGDFVHRSFQDLKQQMNIPFDNYQIIDSFHFGGYAKTTDALIDIIDEVKKEQGIQLEPIYTGKMYFAFKKLAEDNYFPINSQIILLHTGGLQGIAGFNEKQHGKNSCLC